MGRGGSNPARLALSLLEDQAIELLLMDIAPSTLTQRLYSSAQQAYWQFCSRLKLSPLLATQDQLILFVPEQTQTKAPSTIKMYLAGIRHYHIISGDPNPLQGTLKLSLVVLKVIQHTKPFKSRPRLPITPYILQAIHTTLDTSAFVDCMLWAACLMGFYGFLEVRSLQAHFCLSLLQTNTFLNRHSFGQLRNFHSAGCKNKVLKDRPIWGRGYYVPWKDQQCPLPGSTNP